MITLKNVVLNFPSLFTLPTINGEKATKYSTKIILDPEINKVALKQLQAAIEDLRKEKFKDGKLGSDRICLRDGDDLGQEVYEGKWVLSASTKKRPVVVQAVKGELEPLTEDDGKMYSGVVVNANVSLWAQDNKFGKRINCELIAVQWKEDGTPLAGGGITREAAMAGFDTDGDDFG